MIQRTLIVAPRPPRKRWSLSGRRSALTLVEVLAVIAVMGVLLAMAAPSFQRTIEQAHADIAGANLRAVWNAQRVFWLENRVYATKLSELESLDLLDSTVVDSKRYGMEIVAADAAGFVAAATRVGSNRWTGGFKIDQTGSIAGAVTAPGEAGIEPGFQ